MLGNLLSKLNLFGIGTLTVSQAAHGFLTADLPVAVQKDVNDNWVRPTVANPVIEGLVCAVPDVNTLTVCMTGRMDVTGMLLTGNSTWYWLDSPVGKNVTSIQPSGIGAVVVQLFKTSSITKAIVNIHQPVLIESVVTVVGNLNLTPMAPNTVKSRLSAGTGNPEDNSLSALRTAMGLDVASLKTLFMSFMVNDIPGGGVDGRVLTTSGGVSYQVGTYTNSIPIPQPPLGPITDDTANVFTCQANPAYPAASQYEYSINGSAYTFNAGVLTISGGILSLVVGNISAPIGQVKIRVKATASNSASIDCTNTVAFTVDPLEQILLRETFSNSTGLSANLSVYQGWHHWDGNPINPSIGTGNINSGSRPSAAQNQPINAGYSLADAHGFFSNSGGGAVDRMFMFCDSKTKDGGGALFPITRDGTVGRTLRRVSAWVGCSNLGDTAYLCVKINNNGYDAWYIDGTGFACPKSSAADFLTTGQKYSMDNIDLNASSWKPFNIGAGSGDLFNLPSQADSIPLPSGNITAVGIAFLKTLADTVRFTNLDIVLI